MTRRMLPSLEFTMKWYFYTAPLSHQNVLQNVLQSGWTQRVLESSATWGSQRISGPNRSTGHSLSHCNVPHNV